MPPVGYIQLKPSPVHTGTPHLLLLTKASHGTFKVLHGHRDYAPDPPELISLLPHRLRDTFWFRRVSVLTKPAHTIRVLCNILSSITLHGTCRIKHLQEP